MCDVSLIHVDAVAKSIKLRGRGRDRLLHETKKRVDNILKKEKEFACSPEYIRQKKGVKEYLMHLGCLKEVQYPSYWKCRDPDCELNKEALDPQSELYKEVHQMVNDTWEADKAGHGKDATGLKHTKLVIRKIYLIENRKHFEMYNTLRKQVCMEAAINRFQSLKGLKGEQEVKTRTLGACTFALVFAILSILRLCRVEASCMSEI